MAFPQHYVYQFSFENAVWSVSLDVFLQESVVSLLEILVEGELDGRVVYVGIFFSNHLHEFNALIVEIH